MAEKTEEVKTEEQVELNLPELSDEQLAASEKTVESYNKYFTPPEGSKLIGKRVTCTVHGDVSKASLPISYTRYFKKDGKVVPVLYRDTICLACISESLGDLWRAQSGKEFGKIIESPVFATEEELKKLQEEKEKASEEKTEAPTEEKAE